MTPAQSREQLIRTSPLGVAARQNLGRDWFDAPAVEVLGWVLVSAYLLLEVLAGLATPLSIFHECIPLVSAELINHGQKPIVDFYYLYPPFVDYVYAIVFQVLGGTLLVPRIVSSILYIAVAIQAARFFRERAPALAPLGPLASLVAAVSLVSMSGLPVWPSYAFGLLAMFSYPASADPGS
jgi:hypothetical protein